MKATERRQSAAKRQTLNVVFPCSFLCLVLFKEKCFSGATKQESVQSKQIPQTSKSNFQQFEDATALKFWSISTSNSSVSELLFQLCFSFRSGCCCFECVNLCLLKLMPPAAPTLSFIAAHSPTQSLSLPPCSLCSLGPSYSPPSLSVMHGSGLQSSHPPQNKHMRRVGWGGFDRFVQGGWYVDTVKWSKTFSVSNRGGWLEERGGIIEKRIGAGRKVSKISQGWKAQKLLATFPKMLDKIVQCSDWYGRKWQA